MVPSYFSKIIHSNTQHKGIGTRLMIVAENLAAKAGKKRMAVISGVGVRKFYENKLGYTLENNYMTKSIWFKYILCIIIRVDFIVFFSALIVTISHLYSKFY
jgi:predicted N-acetyltransferase YhbS